MRLLWQANSKHVAVWWALLTVAAICNIGLWLLLYSHLRPGDAATAAFDVNLMLLLSAGYVFGCAFRSVLPRADVQRFCLFDTWLSSVVVGRSVATIAEVCFAAQWAVMLYRLGEASDVAWTCAVATVVVPLIVIAQACSWVGVLTTNTLANAIENSIWAFTFGLIALALAPLLGRFDGIVFAAILLAMAGIAAYLAFLVLVDVPMYVRRWRQLRLTNGPILGLAEGWRDAARRRIVTHDLAHWRAEIPWMSLYFTAAVWASLALCLGSSLAGALPNYRSDTVARALAAPDAGPTHRHGVLPHLRIVGPTGESWSGP